MQRIERLNPLFPAEAGHELAATKTDPFDTVLSLSREMVTAVCQVLGAEPLDNSAGGKLRHLRYPPQPASSAYRPDSQDIARVVLGELQHNKRRALDIAVLSNRPEEVQQINAHLADGSYQTWYEHHLDNSTYLPLIQQTVNKVNQNGS